MNLILKDFLSFDISEVYELLRNIYTTSDTMSEAFQDKFPNKNSCRKYFEEILQIRGSIVLFAECEGKLAGFLTVKPRHQAKISHTSELNMGVSSNFRNQGVGMFLIQNALEIAVEMGVLEIIYLMVREDNLAGIKLYEKVGFEKLAVLEKDTKINGKYYSGILMRRFIP